MYIIYSFLAAIFSGLTTILIKAGLNKDNSIISTGLRSIVTFLFTVVVCIIFKSNYRISINNLIFIIISGILTYFLWIVYFKALSLQDVSLVTPIDKLSIILTFVLSSIIFNEKITFLKILSSSLIIIGTFLMVKKTEKKDNNWLIYALLTALFTSLVTIVGKIGLKDVDSNFATMLRTFVVLIIIWVVVINNKLCNFKFLNNKSIFFIILSGISTGISWILYFMALKIGEAGVVFSIEKFSGIIAVLLSIIFLKERLSKMGVFGFIFILIGTLLLI